MGGSETLSWRKTHLWRTFPEIGLEKAKRKADELVHEYENKTGMKSKMKLNFYSFNGDFGNSLDEDTYERTHITPFQNHYVTHGVAWHILMCKYQVHRWLNGVHVFGGYFTDLEAAKHASDELVYKYENEIGKEINLKLNFPRRQNVAKITAEELKENIERYATQ